MTRLFTSRPIVLKQYVGLKTIDTLSWLGGAELTHSPCVQEVPGSISGSSKDFFVCFYVSLLLWF